MLSPRFLLKAAPNSRPLVPQRDQKQISSNLVWRSGFRTADPFIRQSFLFNLGIAELGTGFTLVFASFQRESDSGQHPLRPIQCVCGRD
jgi:hypothetical protein